MNKNEFIAAVSAKKVPSESGMAYRIPDMRRAELEKLTGQTGIIRPLLKGFAIIFELTDGKAIIVADAAEDNLIRNAGVLIV